MLPPPLAATLRGESFMSPVIQLQSASAEHRDVQRRYAAHFSPFSPVGFNPSFNPLAGFAFLTPCLGPAPLPSFEAHVALKRNLDAGHPFSYCYESRTQHRLESVATRTPPPICASAQCSQTALALRTAKRREQFDRTRWLASDNHGISCLRRLFATVASLHVLTPKPSF